MARVVRERAECSRHGVGELLKAVGQFDAAGRAAAAKQSARVCQCLAQLLQSVSRCDRHGVRLNGGGRALRE